MLRDQFENDYLYLKIWVQVERRQMLILHVYPNEPHTLEKKTVISLAVFTIILVL